MSQAEELAREIDNDWRVDYGQARGLTDWAYRVRELGSDLNREREVAIERAYSERNKLVAALAKVFPAHLSPAVPAEEGWNWVAIVDAPCGQLSWHIPDREYENFNFLDDEPNDYDGHSTEEKYRRLGCLCKTVQGGSE